MKHRRIDARTIELAAAGAGMHLDADETASFARSLEHVNQQVFEVRYPDLKGTALVPVNGAVDPGADFYTWTLYDRFGRAARIENMADDFPRVDAKGEQFTTPVKSYGDAYAYTVQDLRRASLAQKMGLGYLDLDTRRAMAAREAIARKIDSVIAFGDSEVGIPGFLNNANVPIPAVAVGTWENAARTGEEILRDVFKLERAIITDTKDVEQPDTLLLPPSLMAIFATKPASATVPTVSCLEYFLQKARYIRQVESWYHLETASAGNAQRIVAYRRDPQKVEAVLPIEFEQLPPQARNLAFTINCHSRCGGTVFHYPHSASYMDGCGGA
jgi:hypothetical protein